MRSGLPLLIAGLALFHAATILAGKETGLWLPGLGIGIALYAWFGPLVLPLLAIDLLAVGVWQGDRAIVALVIDCGLLLAQVALSWVLFHDIARGSRWLEDPRSATLFLILVPGVIAFAFAVVAATIRLQPDHFWLHAGTLWLARALGTLGVLPTLLVIVTPLAMRRYWLVADTSARAWVGGPLRDWHWDELAEIAGLSLCSGILAYLLVLVHRPAQPTADWALWGLGLLVVVWAGIRQGLRGGCLVASTAAVVALGYATALEVSPSLFSPLQGNLLGQVSTALLVGAAAGWVRTNEMRYRHIVGRIPVVLYSARLPQPQIPPPPAHNGQPVSRADAPSGAAIGAEAEVLLVSPTCQDVFGCPPSALLGPYSGWLERIDPEDRELVTAALTQLSMQHQRVTCEYRICQPPPADKNVPAPLPRWVRDTLAPSYSDTGALEGWEGVIEDITEQRALTLHVRRTTGMLQALVANLPTGVYFVQGPHGHPLLVNARARQLLGQREDLSAGLVHLSSQFRLRRPDGSEYPPEDLPIARALRLGVSCSANDIVVHRPDGRKVPLITWAAPIDLANTGKPDAAVWVLEDLTALQQAEAARRESELRLRGIIESMAEGVLVQDAAGNVVDCNPAACAILDTPREQIVGRPSFAVAAACLDAAGQTIVVDDLPDRRVLRHGAPVRDQTIGLRAAADGAVRWLLVSSMPLPVGPQFGLNHQRARVVTTFADITPSLRAAEGLRQSKEKYEHLVENLPLMVLQFGPDGKVSYINGFAAELTGYREDELRQPGFVPSLLEPSQRTAFAAALDCAIAGAPARAEFRLHTGSGAALDLFALLQPRPGHGCTCLVIDLSTQRRLERELQNSQRLDLIGRLASGIVHDFNNLLTVMIGLSYIAKNNLGDDHAMHTDLDRIIEAGEQAAHLAGQLLTFSRQKPLALRAIDLNETVRQTLKLLSSVLPKEIEVDTELASEPAFIRGSETQVKQVLMNLCLNARDAMPQGGRLAVRTGFDSSEQRAYVSVQDSGQGMDEEVRSHIFEAFYSTKERGTGLGLAVVRQIITEMGGSIDVWSQPGAGTRMEVRFRLWQMTPVLQEQAPSVAEK